MWAWEHNEQLTAGQGKSSWRRRLVLLVHLFSVQGASGICVNRCFKLRGETVDSKTTTLNKVLELVLIVGADETDKLPWRRMQAKGHKLNKNSKMVINNRLKLAFHCMVPGLLNFYSPSGFPIGKSGTWYYFWCASTKRWCSNAADYWLVLKESPLSL